LKAGIDDQKIQVDSLPLCFESSELFKEKEEQLVEICQVPFEPMCNKVQESFQVLYDPTVDRLNDEINQNSSPLIDCESQKQDDNGFIRHELQSVKISPQRTVENIHGDKYKGNISVSWHESYPEHLYSCLNRFKISVYIFQDPFV